MGKRGELVRASFAVFAGGVLLSAMLPVAVAGTDRSHRARVALTADAGAVEPRLKARASRAGAERTQRLRALKAAQRSRARARARARIAKREFLVAHRCPVDRPRIFSNDFGDPRTAGGEHTHEGIDLVAPFGTPVRAPFDGRVREGTNPRGGLVVWVDGARGYTYNAHLLRTAGLGGRRVRAGEVIGYVGNSGAARGGPPHLHFEWHPGRGRAVNPYAWLNDLCGARTNYDYAAMSLLGL